MRNVSRRQPATVHFVVRSWIRQALRASGVAILVPAAIAAAIALSVVGGGGGIGSLDDVLNGPAVPPDEATAVPAARPQRDERPRTRAVGVGVAQPRRAPDRGRQPRVGRRQAKGLLGDSRPGQAGGLPASPPATPTPGPPPAPAPAQPHPVHDTGTQVADAVRPLPVAGPVAAQTVQAVVNLVDPPALRG